MQAPNNSNEILIPIYRQQFAPVDLFIPLFTCFEKMNYDVHIKLFVYIWYPSYRGDVHKISIDEFHYYS